MKNQINSLRLSVSFIVAVSVLFLMTVVAFAQSGANVYLQPVESAEGSYVVDVMADNVTDMYGAEFHLKFDPTVFSVQDENPNQVGIQIVGGTLLPSDKGFAVANKVDEAAGTITFAMTLLNPAPAVNGSGPLARVTFNVLSATPTTIEVERAKLVALDLQTIPSTLAPLNVEAQLVVAGQPADTQLADQALEQTTTTEQAVAALPNESSFPWWIVAAVIMILGVLGLGAFIMMTGMTQSKKSNPPKQPVQTKQQKPHPKPIHHTNSTPQSAPRTRPSAFNK